MKIINSNDVKNLYVKAMAYGQSGVGKTYSITTVLPEHVEVINAEHGYLTLSGYGYNLIIIDTFKELMDDVYNMYLQKFKNNQGPKVLFIDSIQAVCQLCMQYILIQKGILKKEITDDMMTWPDWNSYQQKMQSFIGLFLYLPCHVVVLCSEEREKDSTSGSFLYQPDVPGSTFKKMLPGYFDIVVRLTSQKDENQIKRFFICNSDGSSLAKNRGGILSNLEPANWSHILTKIKQGRVKEEKQENKNEENNILTKEIEKLKQEN